MSFTETMIHGLSIAEALRGLLVVSIVVGTLLVFRPLLKGIGRAAALLVQQRILARAELAQRRTLHAERALAARG
ncbi:hypothetical protein NX774_13780 [Massilia agilis]|uniref:Uncharacterized protein n=2 Tax=Massilia TaxID=149698 RepID=A0ABT2BMT6_9BURK|nr:MULTISPECIES: hypothetical protein [Massilia]MCS0609814.1 hypothetical protein [Massilia solisilvae]MCS0808995.1 hypothetical protein [Massilia agilis]